MLIVRKTNAGTYVELGPDDSLFELVSTTANVLKEELNDGQIVRSTIPVQTTIVDRHDWNWARQTDDETLASLGYWKLNQIDAPPGKRQIDYTIEDDNGVPILVPEYEDIPETPEPTPPIKPISFRQFILQLLADGKITADEAIAAAENRTMPATISAVFSSLPQEQQVPARITWATMGQVDRINPLTDLVAAAHQMDTEATDLFFRNAIRL